MNGPYDDVIDVTLRRSDMGFGFRVVGGKEEQTQVSVRTLLNVFVGNRLLNIHVMVGIENKKIFALPVSKVRTDLVAWI